jgi:hypothetical protein
MDNDLKNTVAAMIERGSKAEDVIAFLHSSGCTIAESIKAVMERFSLPLADAKRLVASQPCWKDVTAAADVLHEETLRELKKRQS